MKQPDLLADILGSARRAVPDSEFCIELKMRVFEDLTQTVELARRAEKMGIGLLSIHGRTHSERDDPVRVNTIKVKSWFRSKIKSFVDSGGHTLNSS